MRNEKKNNNEGYFPKLYEACEYMLQNKEEFKSFAIYQGIDKNSTKLSLHNRFLFQFKFLIGYIKNGLGEETDQKGSEIVPKIDIESLDVKTLAKMLVIIDHFINNSNDKDTGRIQINHQVSKVNVDKALPMMDYLVKMIIHDQIHELSEWSTRNKKDGVKDCPGEKEYFKILKKVYDVKRKCVLWECCSVTTNKGYPDIYNIQIQYFWDKLRSGSSSDFPQYTNLEGCYSAWMFVDLCCRSILQYVIQGIIKNEKNKNKLASIKRLNDAIVEMLKVELFERNEDDYRVKLKEEPAKNLFKFYSYFFIRDKFLQDTKILKDITAGYDTNEILVAENLLVDFSTEKNKRSWEEIQNLFEEGYQKHNLKTFKRNVANCLFLIKKLNMMEMEGQTPYTPIRLKALYREFYLEKPKYSGKRKTGMTIINDFLKSDSIKTTDYYFIKEILNKGFFKEYGLLEEFYAKNQLQENLYCLVYCIIDT